MNKKERDELQKKKAINKAKELFESNGKVNVIELLKVMSRLKVIKEFGSLDGLAKAAGLPSWWMRGRGNCKHCEKDFSLNSSTDRYCSYTCQTRGSYRKRVGKPISKNAKILCKNCKDEFMPCAEGGYHYCSKSCLILASSRNGRSKRKARMLGVKSAPYKYSELIERDGMNCAHCKKETKKDGDHLNPLFFNVDHIIPLAKGGHDALYNVQVLCRTCNTKKGSKVLPEDVDRAKSLWPDDVEEYIRRAKESAMKEPALRKDSTTGHKGVNYVSKNGKYAARINKGKERANLGYFNSIKEAVETREKAIELLASGVSLSDLRSNCRESLE